MYFFWWTNPYDPECVTFCVPCSHRSNFITNYSVRIIHRNSSTLFQQTFCCITNQMYWFSICYVISSYKISDLKQSPLISSQFSQPAVWHSRAGLPAQGVTRLKSSYQLGRVLIWKLWRKNRLPNSFLLLVEFSSL